MLKLCDVDKMFIEANCMVAESLRRTWRGSDLMGSQEECRSVERCEGKREARSVGLVQR